MKKFSSRFQPGEGPSRGLLRDYEPSDGTFSSTTGHWSPHSAAAAHPLVLRHFLQPGELSFTTHPYTRAAEIWQEASTL